MLEMRSVSASTSTSGSLFSSPMPRMRRASDIAPPVAIIVFDGIVVLKEFGDSFSVFKTRLRELLRRYCLSKQGAMYFPPHIKSKVI
jgi:hypothetical protein